MEKPVPAFLSPSPEGISLVIQSFVKGSLKAAFNWDVGGKIPVFKRAIISTELDYREEPAGDPTGWVSEQRQLLQESLLPQLQHPYAEDTASDKLG